MIKTKLHTLCCSSNDVSHDQPPSCWRPHLTHVLEDTVPLQLGVPDLALQHHQLLLVLLFERVQTPLAVLQLVDQLLLDRDLAGDVGQIGLVVLCRTHMVTVSICSYIVVKSTPIIYSCSFLRNNDKNTFTSLYQQPH